MTFAKGAKEKKKIRSASGLGRQNFRCLELVFKQKPLYVWVSLQGKVQKGSFLGPVFRRRGTEYYDSWGKYSIFVFGIHCGFVSPLVAVVIYVVLLFCVITFDGKV